MLFSNTLLSIQSFPTMKMTSNFSHELARVNDIITIGISFLNSSILSHFLTKCSFVTFQHHNTNNILISSSMIYTYSIKIIFLMTNTHQETSSKIAHLFICKESKYRGVWFQALFQAYFDWKFTSNFFILFSCKLQNHLGYVWFLKKKKNYKKEK